MYLRPVAVGLLVVLSVLGAVPVSAHTAGQCPVDSPEDRCERWATVHTDGSIRPPHRSDQFPTDVVATDDLVITTMKNVALDPNNPYDATGEWLVTAHDRDTGEPVWTAGRRSRVYDSPQAAALSPDGATLYVTGAAYDAFSVAATDARITTVAYDVATGTELWEQTWDRLPDGFDVGKVIAVSPDGRTVVVGGVTTSPERDLDFITLAYDTRRGRLMWAEVESGIRPDGTDVLNDLAISPDSRTVYVAGTTAGVKEFDADYLTIAYHRPNGRVRWAQRYDGLGEGHSDRATALALAPDGSRVIVTGDSWGGRADGRTQYDYATVSYNAGDGTPLWTARYNDATAWFNSPIGVVATADAVVVTGQSSSTRDDEGRDYASVAYDPTGGTELWRHRYAPARSDDIALHLTSDGEDVYVTGSSSPVVPHTNLDETTTLAYEATTGVLQWTSHLDPGAGDALVPRAMTVDPDGEPVLATQTTRSANPVEGPTSDVYDAIIVAY